MVIIIKFILPYLQKEINVLGLTAVLVQIVQNS